MKTLTAIACALPLVFLAGCNGGDDTTTTGTTVTAPTITTQPASQTATAGGSASFSVVASGSGTLTYQWYKAGTAISGATSATYTIASTTASDAGTYYVIVANSGGSVQSANATLTVNTATATAPSITSQPTSKSVTAGSAASFSVTANGSGTLTYQWYFKASGATAASAISGATAATYTIASTATGNAGDYYVIVTNATGSTQSSTATLTVTTATANAPTITSQPSSQSVATGGSATFSVTASGTGTLTYQWYKDSVAISGATSSTYTVTAATSANAGSYYVIVSNANGGTQSSSATLTVTTTTSSSSCDTTYASNVITALNNFEATLTSSQTSALVYGGSYTSAQRSVYKTDWSNLPSPQGYSRPGPTLSTLSSASQITAFNKLASTALAGTGYKDFQGILAADDYLGYTLNANGYGANNYHVAVIGTPSTTGLWTLMFGGHHMAYNLNFNAGCLYPTPLHAGVEPKATFTANNHYTQTYGTKVYDAGSYTVLNDKGTAMVNVFKGMTSTELQSAFLTSQKFSDVYIGPVEGGTGSYSNVSSKFSAVASNSVRGILVTSLSSSVQSLVTAAITQYVGDYDDTTKARLLSDYQGGYGSTYVAWANSAGTYSSSGPDISADATYMRIEGPRVWIEVVLQNGVIVQNQTHYHMIYRDKTYDYYNELSSS